MSAQPSDAAAPFTLSVVRVARTIRAVRAALPEDQRDAFAADLEDGELPATFEMWWMRAVVYSSPRTMQQLAKLRAGTFVGVPAAEVFGERWTAAA